MARTRIEIAFQWGVALALLVAERSPATAGPSYDLDTKVLHAQAIVEVEITVLPKRFGWEASNRRAREGKVLRTIFKARDTASPLKTPVYFPFSNFSRCWAQLEEETQLRALAFYPRDTMAGLEEDGGAYSSLNGDYDELVEAILTISRWRSSNVRGDSEHTHLGIVSKTSNPYLRFLGARFLKEYEHSSEASVERILASTPTAISYPKAECDRRVSGAMPTP
jgi:hypothetical protein